MRNMRLQRTNEIALSMGKGCVAVPTELWKVVYDEPPPQKIIGFIVPNRIRQGQAEGLRVFRRRGREVDWASLLPEAHGQELAQGIVQRIGIGLVEVPKAAQPVREMRRVI